MRKAAEDDGAALGQDRMPARLSPQHHFPQSKKRPQHEAPETLLMTGGTPRQSPALTPKVLLFDS